MSESTRGNKMDRRDFLKTASAGAASVALPDAARGADLRGAPTRPWRTFEMITEVELWPQDLPARLWLPLPAYGDSDYQRAQDVQWTGNPSSAGIYREPRYGAPAFFAEWRDRTVASKLQLTARVATRNRSVDLAQPVFTAVHSSDELEAYLQSTPHIPT